MSVSLEKDTIAYHLSRPVLKAQSFESLPLVVTVDEIKKSVKTAEKTSKLVPEDEAIKFYMLNHAFASLRLEFHDTEPLGKSVQVIDWYFENITPSLRNMYHYLLLICTRESRHAHDADVLFPKIEKNHGKEILDFYKKIHKNDSTSSTDMFQAKPPAVALGKYTAFLEWIFFDVKFGSSYGGPKWGEVAKCLNSFVKGETSAETMMDTAFTLAHNTGPIFNKGMLYNCQSNSKLLTILDVQRSGQIPQLVGDHSKGYHYLTDVGYQNIVLWGKLKKIVGGDFEGNLDWLAVEKLGAVGAYSPYKSQQAEYFKSVEMPVSDDTVIAKSKHYMNMYSAATKEVKVAMQVDMSEYYQVTPDTKVKKLSRTDLVEHNIDVLAEAL